MSAFARHRRSGAIFATFTGFEADLLRSLTGQLVELLRNEAAEPHEDRDAFEALMDFTGPTAPPDDPVLARLSRRPTPTTRRRPASSAASPRVRCARARRRRRTP